MMARWLLALLVSLHALAPASSVAATSAQPLTPLDTSVLGGEQQEYSVRFFDSLGRPSVGERVRFSNDACGTFQNGAFSVDVATDATGVATATFTARPQGITCWVHASAGVSVRFNVFTYTLQQVSIEGRVYPSELRAGTRFTLIAGAYQGRYPVHGAEVTARAIRGTMSATISPDAGSMGSLGVEFSVVPEDVVGDFEIEVAFRGVSRRFAFPAPASPLQDMWWAGPAENGWGMSVVQHRDMLFSVIYAYDAEGKPVWYVMPGGAWNESRTEFTGALYKPTGTPYSAYDASRLVMNSPVGTATLAFTAASRGTLDYTINGVSGQKSISRQLFGPAEDGAPLTGLGDMWWGGEAQNGWGLALLQQYKDIFGVWFTYDADGSPIWFVMPAGRWATLDSYEGRMYRTTGSPWLGRPYDPRLLKVIDVGSFRFKFSGDAAAFEYTIDGKPGTAPLMRQGF